MAEVVERLPQKHDAGSSKPQYYPPENKQTNKTPNSKPTPSNQTKPQQKHSFKKCSMGFLSRPKESTV
jgi:hypothetical protein